MVSCDTPAFWANIFLVSTFSGFADFCKGRGSFPPVLVFKFSLALSAIIGFILFFVLPGVSKNTSNTQASAVFMPTQYSRQEGITTCI